MESVTIRRQPFGRTRVDMEEYFDDVEVENLYQWLDRIPLSRPKKGIAKDFADGVLVAEIIKHYFPRLVSIHNYPPVSGTSQMKTNWYRLNRTVLSKLNLELEEPVINAVISMKQNVIEKVLMLLRLQIDTRLKQQGRSRYEVDYNYLQESQQRQVALPAQLKDSQKDTEKNSQALVPVKTGRSSPGKQLSPRKYGKGEIPHNHPDRTTYNFEKKSSLFDPSIYIYPTDNVPRSYLEEKEMECLAKDDTIKMLNSKIRRLEHLLQLKDMRLYDLQAQLSQEQEWYWTGRRRTIRLR